MTYHDPLNDAEKGQAPISKPDLLDSPTQSWSTEAGTLKADSDPINPNNEVPKRWQQRFQVSWLKKQPPTKRIIKREPETIIKNIDQSPRGYPVLAAFLDSDENFMIYRRFGFLHARLLLQKQDQLRVMEQELQDMDECDFDDQDGRDRLQCRDTDERCRPTDGSETRTKLLERIETTVLAYDQILLNAQQLVLANRPASRDYTSVKTFFRNQEPLVEGDRDFIYHSEDLLTLRPGRETAWLDGFIERVLKIFPRSVQHLCRSKDTAKKSQDVNIRYFTKSRIDGLVNVVILAMILLLLVVPVYALYHVQSYTYSATSIGKSNAVCIGIFLVATLLFSAVLSLFTKAKRHEILGAAAAYCAILVVFFGNIGIQSAQTQTQNSH